MNPNPMAVTIFLIFEIGGKMRNKIGAIIVLAIFILIGCSGPRTFVNKETDWSFYQKLGILPFVNLTSDRFAGEKVQSAFITEMYMSGKFAIIEPGEFNKQANDAIREAGTQQGQELSLDMIKKIGDKAGIKGVIEGVVREYDMTRVGQAEYPLISLSLRMIDVPSGTVVWMTSMTKKGGPNLPIISIGETHTLGELTQKACHEVVSNFVGKAF
jgi:polysaccharide biosynthesis protein PelC